MTRIALTMLAGLLTAAAAAEVVTFRQGQGGYLGNADTMLREEAPSTSYATEVEISIDSADPAPYANQGLLRFDNIIGANPGQIPAGSQIVSAKLTFWTTSSTDNNAVRMHRMLQAWNDSDTWNTWSNGIQANGVEAVATADFVFPLPVYSGEPFVADVTASLKAWVEGGAANHGWALLPDGSNGWDFASAENTEDPRPLLSVTYVPEPASCALLALGLLVSRRPRA